MSGKQLQQELAELARAFRDRLEQLQRQGVSRISALPSPRLGAVLPELPDDPPAAAELAAETEPEGAGRATPLPPPAAAESGSREPLSESRTLPEPLSECRTLPELRRQIGACQGCRLGQSRHNLVFGTGNPDAELMFIGEAPGREEDEQGEPFVGAAGQLLTKMIQAMGLQREDVYIANIIKCRPPQNRDPAQDEVEACEAFLQRQIAIIRPKMIVAMGNFAAKTLLRTETGITRLRGRFHSYQGVPLMPTFHPAYLLRNPQAKRPVWEDLKLVLAELARLGSSRG